MATKKKDFSVASLAKKYGASAKFKEQTFLSCGPAFHKATGLPGPACGHINLLIGHSDTGKTTSLILSAIDAQKKGALPVIIVTEQKWNFEHVKEMGFECEYDPTTATWNGPFIFRNDFQYVEQITDYINFMLDEQKKGEIPHDLVFLWDSVGSVPCKMTFEGKGGTMHTARVLSEKIGMGLNQRITGSRREEEPYTNTLIAVNQVWVQQPESIMGQPRIKAKGGEALWLNSSLIFQFGNIASAGTNRIDAQKNGRKVIFATRTKVSVVKNHINGLSYQDSKLVAVTHGYIEDTKEALEEYKAQYAEYWKEKIGALDFVTTEYEVTGKVATSEEDIIDAN